MPDIEPLFNNNQQWAETTKRDQTLPLDGSIYRIKDGVLKLFERGISSVEHIPAAYRSAQR
jgi:hypothetical protein